MNEHSFSQAWGKKAPDEVTLKWKINDNFAGGVPDFFIETIKQDWWVEAKFISPLPKRPTTLIDLTSPKYLSPLQLLWLERRYNLRKDAAVLVGFRQGNKTLCKLFLDKEWLTPISVEKLITSSYPINESWNMLLHKNK